MNHAALVAILTFYHVLASSAEIINTSCKNVLSKKVCRTLVEHHACLTHPERMKLLCSYTCGFCRNTKELTCEQTTFGCCPDGVTPAKYKADYGCPILCKDDLGNGICKAMKQSGFCDGESPYRFKCLHACGLCRKCVDTLKKKCKHIVQYNHCEKKKAISMNSCRSSCSYCGSRDSCYKFACKKGTVCRVDHNGLPFCGCNRKCNTGDDRTGTVCGSDGHEYESLCKLKHADCTKKLTVVKYGKCQKVDAIANRVFRRGLSFHSFCHELKDDDRCNKISLSRSICQLRSIVKICPHACGFCYNGTPCQYTEYGCCPNGISAANGGNGEGCVKEKECKDVSPRFCKRFVANCGHSRHSMLHYCYKSCNYCIV